MLEHFGAENFPNPNRWTEYVGSDEILVIFLLLLSSLLVAVDRIAMVRRHVRFFFHQLRWFDFRCDADDTHATFHLYNIYLKRVRSVMRATNANYRIKTNWFVSSNAYVCVYTASVYVHIVLINMQRSRYVWLAETFRRNGFYWLRWAGSAYWWAKGLTWLCRLRPYALIMWIYLIICG